MTDATRTVFQPDELKGVLARYDLGAVQRVRALERGSGRTPKALVESDRGSFILKRRDERADPFVVAFSQQIQLELRRRGVATPAIIGTVGDNNTMVQVGRATYELFEHVPGSVYGGTSGEAESAGAGLSAFHRAMVSFEPSFAPPAGPARRRTEPEALTDRIDPAALGAVRSDWSSLLAASREARAALDRLGVDQWRPLLIHGDFHPGNAIFGDGQLAAILDFDAARRAAPVIDLAPAALHFALVRRGADPAGWPDAPVASLLESFWYGAAASVRAHAGSAEAAPHLMREALAEEAALMFARGSASSDEAVRGEAVVRLAYAAGLVRWLGEHAGGVQALLAAALPPESASPAGSV